VFSTADLSIVIPTRRRWDILRRTLDALRAQTVSGFEVIVVVDGTDDEPPPELSDARVLQQEHAGPGVARNRGVEASQRKLVMFIGDDMIPRPDFVATHVARHNDAPTDEAAVLGRIVWHPDVPRDRLHSWLDWSAALFDYRALGVQFDAEAGWGRFYSSNVSLKRAFFLAAGGFDPDFGFDYEDLDFGYRLGQSGMRLAYEPSAVVEHLHPYDWDRVRRRYESRAHAERLMMSKHDWFQPWFHGKIEAAASQRRVGPLWALAVDWVPIRASRARKLFERRADRWYLQRLAPAFREAWERADGA
jgi:GT2 family glycosyltransferase